MKKRLLSLILLIAVLTTLPLAAFGAETELELIGRRTLSIPFDDVATYSFSAGSVLSDGSVLVNENATISAFNLPDGVEFTEGENEVIVYPYVYDGESFYLTVSADGFIDKTYEINLTDSLIINPDFLDYPTYSGWSFESSDFTATQGVLTFTNSDENYVLLSEENIHLKEGMLYDLSFDIKSDFKAVSDRNMESYIDVSGNEIYVYVKSPSTFSYAAISHSISAEYEGDFSLKIMVENDGTFQNLSIKNLKLRDVFKRPASIVTSVPQAFSAPKKSDFVTPLDIYVIDQKSDIIEADLTYRIYPATTYISFKNNVMTLKKGVKAGTYDITVSATNYPDVKDTFSITITDDGIDNGNFERDGSELSWIPSGNGEYAIKGSENNHYASFTLNDYMGILYNNAYVNFEGGESIVFSADLKQIYSDATAYVTFVIEDINNPENMVLAAYFELDTTWKNYKAIFTPEEDIEGRFIVVVEIQNAFDSQTVYMDNIEVTPAEIKVENLTIDGTPKRGKTLSASYDIINNFDGESTAITNWGVSNYKNGPYTLLSYSNMDEIEVTEAFEGKYLRFEVTAISLTAGLFGETVYSLPIKIDDPHEKNPDGAVINPPSEIIKDNPLYISPAYLGEFSGVNLFSDLTNHWAMEDVNILSAASVLRGYGDGTFNPDANITRAEFVTALTRALSLEGGTYSGIFKDVLDSDWYAPYVQTIYNCGLINGDDLGNFNPNANITRQDMVTILCRTYSLITHDSSPAFEEHFADFDKVADYAEYSVKKFYNLGLINGDDLGNFNPLSNTRRCEAAALIKRLLYLLDR